VELVNNNINLGLKYICFYSRVKAFPGPHLSIGSRLFGQSIHWYGDLMPIKHKTLIQGEIDCIAVWRIDMHESNEFQGET
jgi:hypothetical protein